ncbi:MAG: AMP-binding protein [Clostridia bacterium]|nr:AMP-binding protein [Clostridia bacterium]
MEDTFQELKNLNSLKDVVNDRFEKFNDRIAFLDKDGSSNYKEITYIDLKGKINSFGTVLLEKFHLNGKKIAVIGENSYRWYITYMATICGVGIIVPLDKELPSNEILNLIKRSDAKCIVYSSRREELINQIKDELDEDMIYINMNMKEHSECTFSFDQLIEEGKEMIKSGDRNYLDAIVEKEEFRILLFTSGTMSTSKGVMLSHKNLIANTLACYKLVPQVGSFTFISVLPIHHTYEFSLTYLYATCMGAKVGICEGLKYMSKNIKEIKPDILIVVPAIIERVNQKIEKSIQDSGKEKAISFAKKITNGLSKIGIDLRRIVFKKIQENFGGNLKYLLCGAAPLDKELIQKMEAYGFIFMQGYGATEASPLISATTLDNRVAGTVGKAVYGTELRIDLSGNEDENSNIGEIITKGDNIMIGYYQDEKKTAEALRKGWFYTGDLGYFDMHGNLVVTGRSKNVIVTSNGKNIYPEEIENEINKISLVKESMVYGKKDKKNKQELIVTARVTLDKEYLEETYGKKKPTDKEIYNMIWNEIKKINRSMVSYKAIKKLEVKNEDFVKTTTLKIKRLEEIEKNTGKRK